MYMISPGCFREPKEFREAKGQMCSALHMLASDMMGEYTPLGSGINIVTF